MVKIKDKTGGFEIVNGNWMVILVALAFIIGLLVPAPSFSSFDKTEIERAKTCFVFGFGGNLMIRFFAYLRGKIEN